MPAVISLGHLGGGPQASGEGLDLLLLKKSILLDWECSLKGHMTLHEGREQGFSRDICECFLGAFGPQMFHSHPDFSGVTQWYPEGRKCTDLAFLSS